MVIQLSWFSSGIPVLCPSRSSLSIITHSERTNRTHPKTTVPILLFMQCLITILAALLTASRIVRLRFSVIAASRFDQKP